MPPDAPSRLDDAPTPGWWRRLATPSQLVLLAVFLPGVLAHELTHAVAAWPWGRPRFQWDHLAVDLHWRPETPQRAVWAAHLAPFLAGWAVGLVALAAALDGQSWLLSLRLPSLAYLVFQWSAYTWLVLWDIDALRD